MPTNTNTNNIKSAAVQQSIKYTFYLIALLMLCGVSVFAFKYLFSEVKNNTKEALPWNRDSKEDQKKEEQKIDDAKEVNRSVVVNDIEWKVLDVKRYQAQIQASKKDTNCNKLDDYDFIYVKFSTRNLNKLIANFTKANINIYDKEGVKYDTFDNVDSCVKLKDDSTQLIETTKVLQEGDFITYSAYFLVPKSSQEFRLKVGDLSVLSTKYEYIDLGV